MAIEGYDYQIVRTGLKIGLEEIISFSFIDNHSDKLIDFLKSHCKHLKSDVRRSFIGEVRNYFLKINNCLRYNYDETKTKVCRSEKVYRYKNNLVDLLSSYLLTYFQYYMNPEIAFTYKINNRIGFNISINCDSITFYRFPVELFYSC